MHNCLELFLEYLKSEKNASPNTVQSYFSDLQDFLAHVDMNSENPKVTEEKVVGYLEIPDDDITTFCQADTRKGVSIRYLTDRTAS